MGIMKELKSMLRLLSCKLLIIFLSVVMCYVPLVFAQETPYNQNLQAVYPTINYGSGAKADQIKRGEYLVKVGDCIACHTDKKGKILQQSFAGGLLVPTPFGAIYSPNITPDKTTGIGNWTLADFDKAMRRGISQNGHYLYPAFPYAYFTRISAQDIADMKAYLDAIPPVYKVNKSNQMYFPFNFRFLQLGWRLLFFHQGQYIEDKQQNAQWNRGAYLVLGLGHCDMCHTPMHYFIDQNWILGAPIKKYHLSGGYSNVGYYAPPINNASLELVTDPAIADVFSHDQLIEGGPVTGTMLEVTHDSLKYLSQADMQAIAIYLRSVKSELPPKNQAGLGYPQGKTIYSEHCARCHFQGQANAPVVGDTSAWDQRLEQGLSILYSHAINGYGAMPAKGLCMQCSDHDIEQAVLYMLSVSTSKLMDEIHE